MFKKDREGFFQKKFLFFSRCSNRNMKWSFDNPAEIFQQKNGVLLSKVRAWFENWTIFKRSFLCFRLDLWTRRSQFWQIQRNFHGRGPTIVYSISENDEKAHIFFKKRRFFLETFWWKHRMQLWKPLKKLTDKRLKKLARSPNMIKRPKSFLKNFFPQNGPTDRQKAVFTALSSLFWRKAKEIANFAKLLKRFIIFCGKTLFFEMLLWNMESSFGNPK